MVGSFMLAVFFRDSFLQTAAIPPRAYLHSVLLRCVSTLLSDNAQAFPSYRASTSSSGRTSSSLGGRINVPLQDIQAYLFGTHVNPSVLTAGGCNIKYAK